MDAISSSPKRRVFLSCVGDANDRDAFSGTPFHFLDAAKRAGLVDEGLNLPRDAWRIRSSRLWWKMKRVLHWQQSVGYQYSDDFLGRLWSAAYGMVRGGVVVNQFQLYPEYLVRDHAVEKWFYIDGSLKQLFNYYGSLIDSTTRAEIFEREAYGYRSATGIVTLSNFAAESVIREYGVPAEKVHIVIPGANILPHEIEQYSRAIPDKAGKPLQLLFVGREWKRKGLDRLLRAMLIAQAGGVNTNLKVVGCCRDDVPIEMQNVPNVQWCGMISRQKQSARLFELMVNSDVGCLLSRQEFSSIALREYLAFGMIVMGPKTGGCCDLMEPEASFAVAPEAPDEEIAEILIRLWRDRQMYDCMKESAMRLRSTASWEHSVEKFRMILSKR